MSNDQTPERSSQQVASDMDFEAFDMFTNDAYLDDESVPSCDFPLPSIESGDHLPDNFFDSAVNVDFDFEDLHSDMSVWPAGDLLGYPENLPAGPVKVTPPPLQHTQVLPTPPSSAPLGSIEALWRPLMGSTPIKKSLPNPPTRSRAPAKPRAPKPKPAVKAKAAPKPKVSKVTKTKKPATLHKRTVSAPSGPPRSVQELYNLPWSHLSQEEKGLLLLPLLQGIDPNTGIKIGEAGALLPPPQFEMIGEDLFGTGDSGVKLMKKRSSLKTSSPAVKMTQSGQSHTNNAFGTSYVPEMIGATSSTNNNNNNPIDLTGDNISFNDVDSNIFGDASNNIIDPTGQNATYRNIDDEDAAVFRACNEFNKQHSAHSVSDFSFDEFTYKFDESNFENFNKYKPVVQSLGGPCGNGIIGSPVHKLTTYSSNGNSNGMTSGDFGQVPTPSGDYGRKRQQEALKRNAMLRAAGRRR